MERSIRKINMDKIGLFGHSRSSGFGTAGSRRGSMMVEAAIVLPLFIVGSVSIGFLIKDIMMQMILNESMLYGCRTATIESVSTGVSTPFSVITKAKITQEVDNSGLDPGEIQSVEPEAVTFSASGKGTMENSDIRKDSVKAVMKYRLETSLPLSDVKWVTMESAAEWRNWTGVRFKEDPFSFSAMEDDGTGNIVYIFPAEGECYHTRNCRVLNPDYTVTYRSDQVEKKYAPCELCGSVKVSDSEKIAVFENGSCFHRLSCQAVTKRYTSMSKSDAVARGYRACSYCRGIVS